MQGVFCFAFFLYTIANKVAGNAYFAKIDKKLTNY